MRGRTKNYRAAASMLLVCASVACTSSGGGGDGAAGAVTFAKSYGGPAREQATAAKPRPGGGYVFAGTWNNRLAGGGRVSGIDYEGDGGDFWLVALDSEGDIQWQRSYGRPSILPPGATPRSQSYYGVRAALDLDDDGQRDGAWLVGRLGGAVPTVVAGEYTEVSSDLLITRLDAADRVVWSRAYDSGPFPNFSYALEGEQTSEAATHYIQSNYLDPTADGGAVVAVEAKATVTVANGGSARVEVVYGLYVVKVDANGDVQWSTVLTYPERQSQPSLIVVRGLANGSAVVGYSVPDAQRLRVLRLDAGVNQTASVRWQRDFDGDSEHVRALLAVDDDVDGTIDGILLASEDASWTLFDGFEGVLRKLDPIDGSVLWRVAVGKRVLGVDSTCVTQGVLCNYVVLGDDDDGLFVRTLLRSTGGTIAERDLPDLYGGSSGTLNVVEQVRYRAPSDRYQLVSPYDRVVRFLDRSLNPIGDVTLPEILFAGQWAADVDGGYLVLRGLDFEDDDVRRIDPTGTASPPVVLGNERTLERAYAVQPLAGADGRSDAGFVVAGDSLARTQSGALVTSSRAAWVLRLDAAGNIGWQKRLEGFTLRDSLISFFPLAVNDLLAIAGDGAIVLGGGATSVRNGGRVVKLTPSGAIQWSTGVVAPDAFSPMRALRATADGGFFAAGWTNVGDVAAGAGSYEGGYVARLDSVGAFRWGRRYSHFTASDVRETADGGVLLVGRAEKQSAEPERSPSLVGLRLDAAGGVRWGKEYFFGQSQILGRVRIAPAADGGYVMAATVADAIDPAASGRFNVLLIKIADDGSVQWSQSYGGLYDEAVHALEPLADGGFVVSAQSDSLGDYTEAWTLRVGPDGRISEGCNADLGRGRAVARDLNIITAAYTPPAGNDAQPLVITPVDTNVAAAEPTGVVTARQCRGVATNNPGNIPNARRLTVNPVGSLTGVVTSLPQGIVCGTQGGGVCSAEFADATLVSLRVDIGSVQNFRSWGSGCDSVRGSFGEICDVRMNANKTIDVVFGAPPPPPPPAGSFTLSVTIDRLGGFVGSTDGSFSCTPSANFVPRTCTVQYPPGTLVDLYAASLPGGNVMLEAWSGDCAGFGGRTSISLTMNRDYACRAIFATAP